MPIGGIHHLQINMPLGMEDQARRFYADVLGLSEIPKPTHLQRERGGVWFATATIDLHLSARAEDSPPGVHRHFALQVDNVDMWREKLITKGQRIEEAPSIEGWNRFFTYDPFGNKIEILEIL